MIIHHSGRLHERIADRGSHELETVPLQVLAHCIGMRRRGRYFGHAAPSVLNRRAADELPDVIVETAELRLHGEEAARVMYCGFNLQAVAHDRGISDQLAYIHVAEACHLSWIKAREGCPVAFALTQDGIPG